MTTQKKPKIKLANMQVFAALVGVPWIIMVYAYIFLEPYRLRLLVGMLLSAAFLGSMVLFRWRYRTDHKRSFVLGAVAFIITLVAGYTALHFVVVPPDLELNLWVFILAAMEWSTISIFEFK